MFTARQHTNKEQEVTKTVVKTSNNLTVIVPQKQTKKIKLNRNKVASATTLTPTRKTSDTTNSQQDKPVTVTDKVPNTTKKVKQKAKKSRGAVKDKAKDGSDHDEITLQLSDSEKMDLLEEFEKQSNEASTSDSEEDSSDSESSSRNTQSDKIPIETTKLNAHVVSKEPKVSEVPDASVYVTEINGDTELCSSITDQTPEECHIVATENKTSPVHNVENVSSTDIIGNEEETHKCVEENPRPTVEKSSNPVIEVSCIDDIPIQSSEDTKVDDPSTSLIENFSNNLTASNESHADPTNDNNDQVPGGKSDGEVSGRSSSEIESTVMQPEVVCISDEDTDKTGKNKKKKKDKKSKKEKKNKRKKSDFREISDQNFYKDIDNVGPSECHDLTETCDLKTENICSIKCNIIEIDIDSDNVYEVLEISDDSSCYEVEGISVLSKEPTSEEIEALSAKIDHEIEREVIATDEHIIEHDFDTDKQLETEEDAVANISWKDRYLKSTKVKRVLTTANILNALRKKNKELKKKLEESKKTVPEIVETPAGVEKDKEEENNVEVGSIEHFNTLQGSTTYVDPVKEVIPEKEKDLGVQMKKDAKKLLKMYKRLLKYNDMEKKKDPSKPKKKKTKKHKKSKNTDANNTTNVTL